MGIFRQFPYSNFHDMNMDQIIEIVKSMVEEWVEYNQQWNVLYENINTAFESFTNDFNMFISGLETTFNDNMTDMNEEYHDFIDSINVESEMRSALDSMIADGSFANAVGSIVASTAGTWLSEHISNPTNPPLDDSLSVNNCAAEAKVTGFNIDFSPLNTTESGRIHYDFLNKRIYTDEAIRVISNHFIDTIPAGINITQNDIPWSMNLMCWNFSTHQIDFVYPSDMRTTVPKNYAVIAVIQKSNFSMSSVGNLMDDPQYDERYRVINPYNLQYSQIRIHSGDLFITACGPDIFIDSAICRIVNVRDMSYHDITSQRLIDAWSNSVRYITYKPDTNEFYASTVFSRYAIAMVQHFWVYPLIDGIHANYRALQNSYIRSGSSYYINVNRLGYEQKPLIRYEEPDIKLNSHLYKFVQPSTVAYQFKPTLGTTPFFTLTQNTAALSNKKILMIGDSFVARGWLQHWLNQYEPSLRFIGTETTQYYNYKSEGISGSRISYFTDLNTSPFAINGALDFTAYLQHNELPVPDYVVINTAINQTAYDSNNYFNDMQTIIDMIHTAYPDIKIYVTFGSNYALDAGSSYGYPNRRFFEVRICCNSVYALSDCTIIPIDFILDDEIDYPHTTINDCNIDIQILSDCVHPTENQGFKKMADMIYNYLGV